jgi:Amt family ammonium transporter
MLGYDDSLDVFGVHGVGGITGALLTAIFCDPSLGGTGVYDYVANEVAPYSMSAQFIAQLWAVGTTIVWSGVVSVIAFAIVRATIGLRVSEDQEREGLDTVSHGERLHLRPRGSGGTAPGLVPGPETHPLPAIGLAAPGRGDAAGRP